MTRIKLKPTSGNGLVTRAATQYGRRLDESTAMAEFNVSQDEWKQVNEFDLTDLKASTDLFEDELHKAIVSGARIKSATLKVTEAAAGGTSINIGTYKRADGTALDADGIDAAILTAALTAGAFIDCDGAQVGAGTGLTEDAFVNVVATGTYTAGKFTLVVHYEKPGQYAQELNG